MGATSPAQIRRFVGWTLVACLVIAAITASVALVSGAFDDTDWRIIGTSLGFALASALSASGVALRARATGVAELLGAGTVAVAGLSFVLFVYGLWIDDSDALWQVFGATAVLAFAGSHACLVTGARRPTDSDSVSLLAMASIALGAVDAAIAVLAIAGALHISDAGGQFVGVLVIALLLTSALQPILRKLQRSADRPAATSRDPAASLAEQVLASADRIEALNGDPGIRAPEIRRELERLRQAARQYSS